MVKRRKQKRESGWVGYDPPISSSAARLMLKDPAITKKCTECGWPILAGAQRRFVRWPTKYGEKEDEIQGVEREVHVVCIRCAWNRTARDRRLEEV